MSNLKSKFQSIHELLSQIESEIPSEESAIFSDNYNALELPGVISDIVDFLQPFLTPYEATFYWFLFSNSIVKFGKQEIRVSVRGLMNGVVKSSSGQSEEVSFGKVSETLKDLEKKGCIMKLGEPNREGTPYKILLPDEIEICLKARETAKVEAKASPVDEKDIDYYNVRENRKKVFERDGYQCTYCKKQLTRFTATLDHVHPISKGGDNSLDNLRTSCIHCNSKKNNREISEFMKETV